MQKGCLPVQGGNVEVGIDLLLTAGANPNKVAFHGRAALHLTAQRGHLRAVKALLRDRRIRIDLQDDCGCTPLHLAAEVRFMYMNISPEC